MTMNNDKKVLFVTPGKMTGMPASTRIKSFVEFFQENGFIISFYNDLSRWEKLLAIFHSDLIFLSMPPFRHWWLALLTCSRIILDWRDGWSIAMKTGYGSTTAPNKFKALFAKVIELAAILVTKKIIVCTKGLLSYHRGKLPSHFARKIALITNGHSLQIYKEAFHPIELYDRIELNAICMGKFVEYGKNKALHAINTLLVRYPKATINLQIIGADITQNSELIEEIRRNSRIRISLSRRVSYPDAIAILRQADIAIAIIRDVSYEYGTKVFDYIACGKPILDIFEKESNFKHFFASCFDTDYECDKAYEMAIKTNRTTLANTLLSSNDFRA